MDGPNSSSEPARVIVLVVIILILGWTVSEVLGATPADTLWEVTISNPAEKSMICSDLVDQCGQESGGER